MPGQVIQGFFRQGSPRLAQPVQPATVQPRVQNAPRLQAHPAHLRSSISEPRPASFHPAQIIPVLQCHPNGTAMRLPENLSNFRGAGGQPLPDPVRQKMESFFGTSFADVRVHVGQQASSIGALAFTHGSDLYFAPGQYAPNSAHGQQLLGHELTHVVQQRSGRVRNPFGSGIAIVQDRAMESEADRMGMLAATYRAPVQAKLDLSAKRPAGAATIQMVGNRSRYYHVWQHAGLTNGAFLDAVRQWIPRGVYAYLDFGDFTGNPSVRLDDAARHGAAMVRGWLDNALGNGNYTLQRGA